MPDETDAKLQALYLKLCDANTELFDMTQGLPVRVEIMQLTAAMMDIVSEEIDRRRTPKPE